MCIIIAKDKGISIPDRTILKNCFDNNPDGAGIMWNESEFVHIQKGFMLWKDFNEFLNSLSKRIDLKLASVVMHFRITTHGRTHQFLPYDIHRTIPSSALHTALSLYLPGFC